MAFSNPLPSLAPMDLLIGILGAVLIRLIVYVKGKNAKKYRKGIEYGSARWGTAEDIKPYTDPVFQNNVLLTQTERLSLIHISPTILQLYVFLSRSNYPISSFRSSLRRSISNLEKIRAITFFTYP